MSTQFSCYVCGDDVEETATTRYFEEMGCEMPVCKDCDPAWSVACVACGKSFPTDEEFGSHECK